METLPLFPGLFPPAPPTGARKGRKGKARAEAADGGEPLAATVAAVVEAMLPLGSGPVVADAAPAPVSAEARGVVEAPVVEAPVVHLVEPARPRRSQAGVVLFDVETTGTDRRSDQVIELCMQRGLSGTDYKIWRFKPTTPIHPRAQKVHGISMEDLADCPAFATCVDEIDAWLASAQVIIGYNLAFDIDMLRAEYERAGRQLHLDDKKVVDPYRLWQQREPRKLVNAHQRFVGNDFEAAHSAAADVAATGRVLEGMLVAFGLDHHDWADLEKICDPERGKWIGPTRHVQWDEEGGFVVLSFGKHRDKPLHSFALEDRDDYLGWICGHDFPDHVKEICRQARDLAGDGVGFHAWVRQRFGAQGTPAATSAAVVEAAPAAPAVASSAPAARAAAAR